jgi:hypothetical protein
VKSGSSNPIQNYMKFLKNKRKKNKERNPKAHFEPKEKDQKETENYAPPPMDEPSFGVLSPPKRRI